jgi:putative transposase
LIDGVDVRLKELLIEKELEYGYEVIEMEIMPEHVHILLDINPQIGVVSVIGKIKGYTAHTLRKEFPWLKKRIPCLWTRSKFISTVGAVSLDVVKQYIEDQKGK